METFYWPEGFGVGRAVGNTTSTALNCPRCNSGNTKFCYYNNYNISQPRYLCKTCKRYWTKGGNLRNVPVGGGTRKNNNTRPSSSCSSSSSSKKVISNLNPLKISPHPNPTILHNGETLNLDFDPLMSEFGNLPPIFELDFKDNLNPRNPSFSSSSFSDHLPVNSRISMPVSNSDSVFSSSSSSSSSFNNHMDEFDPGLCFSLDGLDQIVYGNSYLQAVQENTISTSSTVATSDAAGQFEQLFNDSNNGYWNGVMNFDSW
ncbi:hypothetical protein OROGR_003814 [Orobanche gracilis]